MNDSGTETSAQKTVANTMPQYGLTPCRANQTVAYAPSPI